MMTQDTLAFHPVAGVRLGSAAAEIRYRGRDDLVVMELAEGARCAAVFTRNAFCAAPVVAARRHLALASPRYLLINSGNANAGTGSQGLADAEACCTELARIGGCSRERVVPFSTGVIGEDLPLGRMQAVFPRLLKALDDEGWPAAARAIMTTDTRPKLVSRQVALGGQMATVTGMAKGAGMICPDMATMLAFLATDAAVAQDLLQICLERAVAPSFNSITVDGDTSTNDACVLAATGRQTAPVLKDAGSADFATLCGAVEAVCLELAKSIVADGEGATKLVAVAVEGALDEAEARRVAYTVAHSPLVKTALFAADPNWGRILAAVGRADLQGLDIDAVRIWLDDVCIVRGGGRAPEYRELAGRAVMDRAEFGIRVDLGRGEARTRVLTCDLSYDYVRINAEYRT
jgi:glutamate N-acetyltransferase/amino-acid N-acetyltransferase